jgi:hypothetical protein
LKILILIFLLWPVAADAYLHATTAEIAVWNSRRVSGPYKSSGDVSTNSPGDWDRILSNADAFVKAPTVFRWSGQTSASCWSSLDEFPAKPSRSDGEFIRDAAFVYLLTGTADYRTAVLAELLAQAAVTGTKFEDNVRWIANGSCVAGDGHSWEITGWLTRYLFAWDYIRPTVTGADRTTIDTWFQNAAEFWHEPSDIIAEERFANRDTDDYTTYNTGYDPDGATTYLLYATGPLHTQWAEGWNNRSTNHVRFVGLAGILLGDTALKDRAKRWWKETIRYNVLSDGTIGEIGRATDDGLPGLGFSYVGMAVGSLITLADAFARNGDFELYQYSTSDGKYSTTGGPKTLASVITTFVGMVNHTVTRYQGGHGGEANYIIDPTDPIEPADRVMDTYVAQANMYYRNATTKTLYMRTAGSAPAYPANPSNPGGEGSAWMGEWNVLPGALFMFGQMEDNAANPYVTGGGGGRRRLAAVTNLSGQIAAISPSTASVSLGWTDPNTAIDQSEDGTAINREIAGTFQQVGSVGPNVTKFSESFPATAGSQQCYIVLPFYSDGLDGADPSNEWCGTVPPCKQKGKSGHC